MSFPSGVNRGVFPLARALSMSGVRGGLRPGLKNLSPPAKAAQDTKPRRVFSSTLATLKGSQGMQLIQSGSVDDGNINVGDIGFDFPFYNATYKTNIFVGSNSYITFGYGSNAYSNIGTSSPGRGIFLNSGDHSYQQVFVSQDTPGESFRIRFEGSLSTSGTIGSPTLVWEVTLYSDGNVQIVTGSGGNDSFITDGTGNNFLNFTLFNDSSGVLTKSGNTYTFAQGSYGVQASPTPTTTPTTPSAPSELVLPTQGLREYFYSGNLSLQDNALVSQWASANQTATQGNSTNQPTYKQGIFANGSIPSVLFSGNKYLNANLSYLAGVKYTIAVVEARTSSNSVNYFLTGSDNSPNTNLHLGYVSNSSIRFAQYSNDLDFSVAAYSSFTPYIWVFSNNSRGHAIWRNNQILSSNSNTTDLISNSGGIIGGNGLGNYYGHLGLIAFYTGDKSDNEIRDIFSAVNSTFKVY
ncbi:hypothetical protein BZZ01_05030 [Nostocales cyanobacterium HT-58-2]|nr:hypothetical protein BZZ01_05030 [Nostocales cyanobacterium HT-58-2]